MLLKLSMVMVFWEGLVGRDLKLVLMVLAYDQKPIFKDYLFRHFTVMIVAYFHTKHLHIKFLSILKFCIMANYLNREGEIDNLFLEGRGGAMGRKGLQKENSWREKCSKWEILNQLSKNVLEAHSCNYNHGLLGSIQGN